MTVGNHQNRATIEWLQAIQFDKNAIVLTEAAMQAAMSIGFGEKVATDKVDSYLISEPCDLNKILTKPLTQLIFKVFINIPINLPKNRIASITLENFVLEANMNLKTFKELNNVIIIAISGDFEVQMMKSKLGMVQIDRSSCKINLSGVTLTKIIVNKTKWTNILFDEDSYLDLSDKHVLQGTGLLTDLQQRVFFGDPEDD